MILYKLLSGRFIFTLVAAFVFAYMSVNSIINADSVKEILLIVIVFYFTKQRTNEKEKDQENK